MELTDMQSSDMLKDKFKDGNFIDFLKCLPEELFRNVRGLHTQYDIIQVKL
jgi:hypothetical protein